MLLHNNTLNVNYLIMDDTYYKDLYEFISTLELKSTHNKGRGYINLALAFDTETTSYLTKDEVMFPFTYIWMITIRQGEKELTIVGRYLEQLEELFRAFNTFFQLNSRKLLVIFIHNYAFEHSFIYRYFIGKWGDMFYTKSNTILYGRLDEYNIEFRCSYLLSGYALAKLPTKLKKLKGELNYDLVRTPETNLSDKEMAYCINDTRVLAEYIDEQLNHYTLTRLPLTKTGFVRRGLEEYIKVDKMSEESYKMYLQNFIIKELHEYLRLKACFCGGHTAVNPAYSGVLLNEFIICYDFTSSYPSVIVRCKFPSKLKYHELKMNRTQYEMLINEGFALSASITFHNLRSKVTNDNPIHLSQATIGKEKKKVKENNGKVVSADQISIDCFELSYKTFCKFYEWDEIEIEDVYVYEKDYLPKKVIEYVLQLYYKKTAYKDVEGFELEYRLAKELLNAIYGCGYTDIVKMLTMQDSEGNYLDEEKNIKLGYDNLLKQGIKELEINGKLETLNEEFLETAQNTLYVQKLEDYNKQLNNVKRCIPYQVGGYVSEIARYNLFRGIYAAGDDYIYSDTDSIFVRHPEKIKPFIDEYNTQVKEEMEYVMNMYNLPIDAWRPKAPNGEEKPLGYWDLDKKVYYFKALRSKCYMYVKEKKGKKEFVITIAGLGKEKGRDYLLKTYNENIEEIFKNFTDDMEIPAEETGKLTHHIIYETRTERVTDYNGKEATVTSYGGTYLEKAPFSISLLDDYLAYIDEVQETLDNYY